VSYDKSQGQISDTCRFVVQTTSRMLLDPQTRATKSQVRQWVCEKRCVYVLILYPTDEDERLASFGAKSGEEVE